jgi:predicted transcriptional regulator
MLSLITLLCIFFIILISYQIFNNINHIVEGLTSQEYQTYDTNDPKNVMILAQQNAGNIIVLKQQLDDLLDLNKEVEDLSNNYVSLQEQVNELVTAQQDYATQLTGGEAPVITGVTSDTSSTTNTTDLTTT